VRLVRTGVRSREITMTDLPVRLCVPFFPLPRSANRVSASPGSGTRSPSHHATAHDEGAMMIVLGVILLILGLLLAVPVLWVIGIILVVIGAVLWISGSVGHEVGGRRHYW